MSGEPEGPTTRALRAWRDIETPRSRPMAPPLFQASTFGFDDMDHFAEVAQTKTHGGYLYSRWANPTVEAVAAVISSLEGTDATACFSSGMAAIHQAITANARAGDHVVSTRQLYGGTHALLGSVLPRLGIDVTTVDANDLDAIEAAFTERTRVLFCETIGNPTLDVADLDALAGIARARDAVLIVDATFTPPVVFRPAEHGADLVLHSATKFLGGHADVVAGVVSGARERIEVVRHLQIDVGGILAPFEAWLMARGIQTLDLRVERACANTLTLARMLSEHPAVERVIYPGLESHPQHGLARKLFGERFGAVVGFDVRGGSQAGRRFLERVQVAVPAASLGGTKTLVVHPASVTHTQLDPDARRAAGIGDGLIRASVGIEDVADLLADFDEALR